MGFSGMVKIAVAALALGFAFQAYADDSYPNRPVTLVVPFPAGGGSDALARVLAGALGEELGQTIIVQNQPGGGTAIATQTVVAAPADGYTLLFSTDALASNIALKGDEMPYDALTDLDPVSLYSVRAHVLSAKPALGVTTLSQLIELAKQKPGQLVVGTSGIGGGGHFSTELLKEAAGIDIVHVPYSGAAPSILDLVGGRIDLVFTASESILPHIQSGAAIPLGVTTTKRSTSTFPDVPTFAETLPGFNVSIWNGVMVPDGTPEAIVAKLNAAVNQAVCCNAAVADRLKTGDAIPSAGTPEQMTQYILDEIARLKPIIDRLGIEAQ